MSVDESKKCKSCALDIPLGARLCHNCGKYQDKRRYIGIGNSFIALLIALFSVIGIVAPKLYELLSHDESRVLAVTYANTNEGISVILNNQGNSAGLLVTAKVKIYYDHIKNRIWTFNLDLQNAQDTRIIEPHDLKELKYSIKRDYFERKIDSVMHVRNYSLDDTSFKYYLYLEYMQYDGKIEQDSLGPSMVKNLYNLVRTK